ncbi:hypothetical protein BV25DRAFT_1856310, partial [Artomyces pyxidatus]
MPKATKKKKEKAADFTKAKLKLGKGKQLPANQVDTSFKARSIALPTQSIAVEKDAAVPTTKRKLAFSDLMAHLKHYNAGSRRDALTGLRELFEGYPSLIEPSLTTLISGCVRIIGDEDARVRKALLAFLDWLLPQIPTQNLLPHSSMLMLFTTSAQTHIFLEIQIDAVRFLNLFLDLIPEVVVGGWRDGKGGHGRRVLEGYLGILNAGTKFGDDGDTGPVQATSAASVVLSIPSKLVVFRSLAKFLRVAFAVPGPASPEKSASASKSATQTWFLAPSFTSPSAYEAFDSLLRPVPHDSRGAGAPSRRWQPETHPEDDAENYPNSPTLDFDLVGTSWTLQDLSESMSSSAVLVDRLLQIQGGRSQSEYDSRLARTLHPVLLNAFLDCSPAVFSLSSNPPEAELGIILAVAEIHHSLYVALLKNSEVGTSTPSGVEGLQTILSHMVVYFPFRPSSITKRDIKTEQAFQDLNLIFCELASISVLALPPQAADPSSKRFQRKTDTTKRAHGSSLIQVEHVGEYVVELLKGEPANSQSLSRHITAQSYVALLPSLWSLLNMGGADHSETSDRVLEATLDHAMRISSSSAVKRPSVEFLSRLVLVSGYPRYSGSFRTCRRSVDVLKFQQWISQLPKMLWELGTNNLPLTEVTFRFLLRLFQRRSPLGLAEVADQLSSRFIPYFTITHPVRGELPGPYTRIDIPELRRLAVDTMVMVSAWISADPRERLDAAIQKAVRGTDQESYW